MNPIENAYSKLKAFPRKIAEGTVADLLTALDPENFGSWGKRGMHSFSPCGYDTG